MASVRNDTSLRLILGDVVVRQPRTRRSHKINMSCEVRPYKAFLGPHVVWRNLTLNGGWVADLASFVRFTDGDYITARPPGGRQAAGRSGLMCTRRDIPGWLFDLLTSFKAAARRPDRIRRG